MIVYLFIEGSTRRYQKRDQRWMSDRLVIYQGNVSFYVDCKLVRDDFKRKNVLASHDKFEISNHRVQKAIVVLIVFR